MVEYMKSFFSHFSRQENGVCKQENRCIWEIIIIIQQLDKLLYTKSDSIKFSLTWAQACSHIIQMPWNRQWPWINDDTLMGLYMQEYLEGRIVRVLAN